MPVNAFARVCLMQYERCSLFPCAEFVQLIASEANTISEEEKRKTINPEHVVKALDRLGFSSFTKDVSQFLEEVKDNDKKCKLQSIHKLHIERLLTAAPVSVA
jgi:Holliday junction resolvasome RuvABC DNA-binding subunit